MDNRWFFNLNARAYEFITDHAVWYRQIGRALRHLDARAPVRRVLDLGCGPGTSSFVLAQAYPEAEVVGIDIAERMIARARHLHRTRHAALSNLRFEVADATRLPFDAGTVDLAVGHSFLYLVPDRAGVLCEVHRVLAAGSTLVLMEPDRRGNLLDAGRAAPLTRSLEAASPGELARFVASMLAWRIVSAQRGQLAHDEVARLFAHAGFASVEIHRTLGGLGMHCVGRKTGG